MQNPQDTFLNDVRKSKVPLTVVLLNGVKLQGILTWFDSFSILLKRGADARGLSTSTRSRPSCL